MNTPPKGAAWRPRPRHTLSHDGLMRRRGKILLARKLATLPMADAAALIQHLIDLGSTQRDASLVSGRR